MPNLRLLNLQCTYWDLVNNNGGDPYGYTGEWYEGYINLLHLRARWYNVGTGTFLSRDVVESEPPYQYVRGNPVNYVDPTGFYAEGEIEEYVNLPLFSVPTSLAEAGDLLHHLGHEPWLLKAIKHPLMVDLHAAVEGHLRRLEFFDQENLPGFYSTVRDEAKRLLLKDGLCGSVDVELEATHLAIIMIAAIPANEHNTPVRPKDLWALYPKFLPDGRWEEPGWDKTGHFFNHAFLTFEGLYMKERRMSYYSSLGQFHAALTFAVNPIPPNPIGGSNLREIDTLNAYYTFFSGPLYVNDITFYDALIGNVSFNDWQIYRMSRDIGLFYELFSTPYPLRSNQDIHYWILQQGHEINMDIIMQGLFDPGVLNDIAANKLGAKFGIRAYHNPLASPPGSMPPQ
jgi:RHS repeat-associated protein